MRGSSAFVMLAIMFVGGLGLWIGIPLAWLWIGSQVESATDSLGAAVATMMIGVVASIVGSVPVLGWLSSTHRRQRMERGHDDPGDVALEAVMVTSAAVALVGFCIWFFLFSGSSPVPLNLGY